jgi:hypothetical protein
LLYGNVALNTASSGGTFNMTDTTRGNGSTYDGNNVGYQTAANRATLFTDADNTWGNNTPATARPSRAMRISACHHVGLLQGHVQPQRHLQRRQGREELRARRPRLGQRGVVRQRDVLRRRRRQLSAARRDRRRGPRDEPRRDAGAPRAWRTRAIRGGLNESTSDIFGTMVEFFANNANDTPDYEIGEEIYASNPGETKALRYMFKPSAADGGASYDCYPAGGLGGVDPHYSSGPANHFFYLLAQGAVSPAGFNFTAGSWCATATPA